MLYVTFSFGKEIYGHIGDESFTKKIAEVPSRYAEEVQADGDELVKCCEILGRQLPNNRVYTFLGNNAQEIAKNWDTK